MATLTLEAAILQAIGHLNTRAGALQEARAILREAGKRVSRRRMEEAWLTLRRRGTIVPDGLCWKAAP